MNPRSERAPASEWRRLTRVVLIAALLVACGGKKDDKPAAKGSAATAPVASDPDIAAFWKWFVDNAAALRADADIRATMEKISAELRKIDGGVFAELGVDGEDRLLVITPDGDKKLFPKVQQIYASRPTVAGWTIVAFRQRAKAGDPPLTIDLGGKKVDPTQVKFVGKSGGDLQLDIEVFIPHSGNEKELAQIGFVMLDHTVGEFDMETKIGAIDFAPIAKAPANAKPLTELPAIVDALK